LIVRLIDELAGMTAIMTATPRCAKKPQPPCREFQGRALGIVVATFLQPQQRSLPLRGLFNQTNALQLRSRDEVTMLRSILEVAFKDGRTP
jgi:hypothetical protein